MSGVGRGTWDEGGNAPLTLLAGVAPVIGVTAAGMAPVVAVTTASGVGVASVGAVATGGTSGPGGAGAVLLARVVRPSPCKLPSDQQQGMTAIHCMQLMVVPQGSKSSICFAALQDCVVTASANA